MIVLLQKPEKKTPLTMKSLDRATKNMIHVSKAIEIIKHSETTAVFLKCTTRCLAK